MAEYLNAVQFPSKLTPICYFYFTGSQPDPAHSFFGFRRDKTCPEMTIPEPPCHCVP